MSDISLLLNLFSKHMYNAAVFQRKSAFNTKQMLANLLCPM